MTQDEISTIKSLACYIENSPLADGGSGAYLYYADLAGDPRFTGYSILGLICCHHQQTTGRGAWDHAEPRRPDYVARPSGDRSDKFLPLAVQMYYGFADKRGTFSLNELSPGTNRLIHRHRNKPSYSLYALPIDYKSNTRRIAAAILRDMPPSLFSAKR